MRGHPRKLYPLKRRLGGTQTWCAHFGKKGPCMKAFGFAHSLPCDTSLGSLTGAMPEARDFVESLQLYHFTGN